MYCKEKNKIEFPKKIIVTGNLGKTTTSYLIYKILTENGYKCHFIQKIEDLPKYSQNRELDFIILDIKIKELIKYNIDADILVVINIDIIDKENDIFKYHNNCKLTILNYDYNSLVEYANTLQENVVYFSCKHKLLNGIILDCGIIKECKENIRRHIINVENIKIKGKYNIENICAALLVVREYIDIEKSKELIINFEGIENSLELVRKINNVQWYNDSIAINDKRVISSLNEFTNNENILLITGGNDENISYTELAKAVINSVKILVLIGKEADKIFLKVKKECEKEKINIKIYIFENLENSIKFINNRLIQNVDIILFSPGNSNVDGDRNYEEIGNKFKKLVQKL